MKKIIYKCPPHGDPDYAKYWAFEWLRQHALEGVAPAATLMEEVRRLRELEGRRPERRNPPAERLHPLCWLGGYKYGRLESPAALAERAGVSRQYVHRNRQPRPDPVFDREGYPTEETLRVIREWPLPSNFAVRDLLSYCRDAWRYRAAWAHRKGLHRISGKRWIAVSTAGWSGNESIIAALRENTGLFWALCWLESRAGGHYKFITAPYGGEDGGRRTADGGRKMREEHR